MENSQKVGLGCGTLILIAIIVLIFGNAGSEELTQEVQQLRQEVAQLNSAVQRLESALQTQSSQLRDIQQLLGQKLPDTN